MTDTLPQRETYRHGDVATQALDRAMESMAQTGGVPSLRALAKAVGVTHAALYRHFDSRNALLDALAGRGFDRLAERIQGGRNRADVIDAYVRFALSNPTLYGTMMTRSNRSFGEAGTLSSAFARTLSAVRGALGDDAEDRDIQALWVMLHGAVSLHGNGILQTPSESALIRFVSDLDKPV
ncbi:MAG: TetR/AcrR family transcriptional regulator [Pseudomonadota bacterium]